MMWEGVKHIVERGKLSKWVPCLGEFCRGREVIMSWDGADRGVVRVNKGVPQGSPLSPIVFLCYIAGMVRGIEESIQKDLDTRVEVISYVDDLAVIVGEVRGNPEAVRQLVEGTVGIQAGKWEWRWPRRRRSG